MQAVSTFLIKNNNMAAKAILREMSFPPKPVIPYSDDELTKFFAACTQEESIIFKFFLHSMAREREVAFTEVRDLLLDRNVLHISPKPDKGFRLKGSITQTTLVNVTVDFAPGFTTGSGGTTSITVTPGSTTGDTGTINVAGTNGFSGTVSLSCSVATTMSGVSDMPTCNLNPTSVTISGTTAQSSTLTVNTTAATSAENYEQQLLWRSAGGTVLALVMFFVTPRRRRNWLALLGAFVLLANRRYRLWWT